MRLLLTIFILLVGQLNISHSQTPYGIKSCRIDFVFSTGFAKGTKTIVFTDSGRIEKEIGSITVDTSAAESIGFPKDMIGGNTVHNQLIIQREDSVIVIDLDHLKGNKSAALHFSSSPAIDSTKNKLKDDTFLGRKCEVIQLGSLKFWYWKGIALKKESPSNDIYEYATSIEENYITKPDEFLVPKNIRVE